jgi:hypothetical protein
MVSREFKLTDRNRGASRGSMEQSTRHGANTNSNKTFLPSEFSQRQQALLQHQSSKVLLSSSLKPGQYLGSEGGIDSNGILMNLNINNQGSNKGIHFFPTQI